MKAYIEATPDTGKRFYQAFHDKGKVVMLNLLKFKSVADYSQFPDLQPKQEISGWEAYQLYMDATMPLLEKAGSKVLFFGKSRHFLIGPEAEQWDTVILVEHPSVARFMAFAQDEDYLRTVGHRTAALADSRLLPITKK
ncbi:MAG: DUF1330 domain-containing protein [Bacteroidota bacterium]